MTYAQYIRNFYFENKEKIHQINKDLGFSHIPTLEHRIKDAYKEYRAFCYSIGMEPKKIIEFLKSEII